MHMNIELTKTPIENIKSDLKVIMVIEKDFTHSFIHDKKLLEKSGFKGDQDETMLFLEHDRLYVGVEKINSANIRTAAASAIRTLLSTHYSHISIASYMNSQNCTAMLRAMTEGLILGAYRFETYKSKKRISPVKKITISLEEYHGYDLNTDTCTRTFNHAKIVANATNFTRDIVNTTPDDCYPSVMARIADTLCDESRLECTVLKPKELKKEKMNALLAVARASRHRPRVIHLSHKPENPKAIVSLVGKGLTYDSGGLSLKPGEYMVTMKSDKSGGAAVLGIMKAISEMNLPIEVHGFVGAVENMIGGNAYKPDDVLKAKNGKTIEVRNTDAEGRLVLADVLAYAQQEVKADYLFDLATLTGACVVGVGNYTSGVMGNSDIPKSLIIEAAQSSGELATMLDFNRYLKKTLKSEIADICNISNIRYGGAITAGMFLSEFIDDDHKDKWAHIDIAGPAFVEHEWGENPYGASGAGVRMIVRLLEKLAK